MIIKERRQSYKKSLATAIEAKDAKKTAANQLECADEIGRSRRCSMELRDAAKSIYSEKMHQNYDVPNSLTVLIKFL